MGSNMTNRPWKSPFTFSSIFVALHYCPCARISLFKTFFFHSQKTAADGSILLHHALSEYIFSLSPALGSLGKPSHISAPLLCSTTAGEHRR